MKLHLLRLKLNRSLYYGEKKRCITVIYRHTHTCTHTHTHTLSLSLSLSLSHNHLFYNVIFLFWQFFPLPSVPPEKERTPPPSLQRERLTGSLAHSEKYDLRLALDPCVIKYYSSEPSTPNKQTPNICNKHIPIFTFRLFTTDRSIISSTPVFPNDVHGTDSIDAR